MGKSFLSPFPHRLGLVAIDLENTDRFYAMERGGLLKQSGIPKLLYFIHLFSVPQKQH